MLSKRDRERYKNAMKDLKDYAIYKEVMEAAMVRLQNELEKIADENKELKVAKVQEERVMLKQKSSSDKYNRELHNSKKRIDELEAKLQKMEKANKSLLKERDTAVHSLAHAQSTGVQKATQFQEMNTMKQKEIDELHRK